MPEVPNFSSGPCAKHPGWSVAELSQAAVGRSHRSTLGKEKLRRAVDETRALLELPDDYRIAIMPGSATGAVEAAMWSLLGPRPVDMVHWEHFGQMWYKQAKDELKLDVRSVSTRDYGTLPDLAQVNKAHDTVFLYNGSAAGVKVPNLDFIARDREGLTICDATSSIFAMDMGDWTKMDAIACAWQKGLGSEAAHGMLILGPRAVERLESHVPTVPIPRIYRMTVNGKLDEHLFEGNPVNTPSLLCVEDYLSALSWARSVGGARELYARNARNFGVMERFVRENASWVSFLAADPASRSTATVTLRVDGTKVHVKEMQALLAAEGVALDINAFPSAPVGLRVWCGPTVETADLEALTLWLRWAHEAALELVGP